MGRIARAILVLVVAVGSGCGREGLDPGGDPDASIAPESPSGVWTNRTRGTGASGQWWLAVASDAAGQHLVATSTTATIKGATVGGFWTSADRGLTWTNRGGDDIGSVASNSTGTVVIGAAGCFGVGEAWELTSGGPTWTLTRIPRGGISVASDATGTRLVTGGGGGGGDLWTSSNSGASWTNQTTSGPAHDHVWKSIASSSTGTKLVAVSDGECGNAITNSYGNIWTSTDSGATWTNRTAAAYIYGGNWMSVSSDASGMNLVAVGTGIWTSTDAGLTWTEQAAPAGVSKEKTWISVASDASGKHLIAAADGNIFTSANAGVTWTNETAGTAAEGQGWIGVASDSSGVHLVAVASFGDIWTN